MNVSMLQKYTVMLISGIPVFKLTVKDRFTFLPKLIAHFSPTLSKVGICLEGLSEGEVKTTDAHIAHLWINSSLGCPKKTMQSKDARSAASEVQDAGSVYPPVLLLNFIQNVCRISYTSKTKHFLKEDIRTRINKITIDPKTSFFHVNYVTHHYAVTTGCQLLTFKH